MDSWAVVNNLVRSRNGVFETRSLRKRHVTEPVGVGTTHIFALTINTQQRVTQQLGRKGDLSGRCLSASTMMAPVLTQWARGWRSYSNRDGGSAWVPSDQSWSSYCHC